MKPHEKRAEIPSEKIKAALTNPQNHPEEMGDSIKALREQCFLNFQAILNTHYGSPDSSSQHEPLPPIQEL